MAGNLLALTPIHFELSADAHPDLVRLLSMLIAVASRLFLADQHHRDSRIERQGAADHATDDGDGVGVIAWSVLTLFLHPS